MPQTKLPMVVDEIRKGRWENALREFRESIEQALEEWEENGPWQAADEKVKARNYELAGELENARKELARTQKELGDLRSQLATLSQEKQKE